MQESIGGVSLTIIVIAMVLLFAGIITLTINRSNAIAVKSQIVDKIENNYGFDMSSEADYSTTDCDIINGDEVLCDILKQLDYNSYRQSGTCEDDGEVVGYQRDGKISLTNANFCIKKININKDSVNRYYYEVTVFYSIDLPVIKQLFKFKSMGQTKILYN